MRVRIPILTAGCQGRNPDQHYGRAPSGEKVMNIRWIAPASALAAAVAITFPVWRHWLPAGAENTPAMPGGGGGEAHRLVLSKQAQANLGLLADEEPLAATVWWRTISVPATVVER